MLRAFKGMIIAFLIQSVVLSHVIASELHPPTAAIPASYFGLHIHHLNYPVPTTPWPSMTVPEWRLWDAAVRWPELEPNKGQWQFERLDLYVSLAEQHGTHLLLTLGMTPLWASGRTQLAVAPKDVQDWRNYVKTVVTRYKGRIPAYEIWNEPNLPEFWMGTTDQMVTLTKEASEIIRSIDPKAIVVSPSPTADFGITWMTEFMKKGGGQYVDVIGYHFYANPNTNPPEEILPVIAHVQQVLAENGMSQKAIWNTETGWLAPTKFDSEDLAAGYLARAYILSWAAGIERFYWYAWDNRSLAIVTYKESEHQVTPAGNAYKIMQQWLVGTKMESCKESADHTWICQLNRGGKKEWIVWNSRGNSRFTVPVEWKVKKVTVLLQDGQALKGLNVDLSPIPMLLTGRV